MINLRRLIKSFSYAFRGLFKVFREEQNLLVQSVIGIIITALGLFFQIKTIEWCLLAIVIALVLLMEITNSAFERIIDTLKPRIHQYVKEAKDIMAAAVMLSSLAAIIVGVIIFWPYLAAIFK